MTTRAEAIATAGQLAAAAWRELAETYAAEGREGLIRITGEAAAAKYGRWVAEDLAEKEPGAA